MKLAGVKFSEHTGGLYLSEDERMAVVEDLRHLTFPAFLPGLLGEGARKTLTCLFIRNVFYPYDDADFDLSCIRSILPNLEAVSFAHVVNAEDVPAPVRIVSEAQELYALALASASPVEAACYRQCGKVAEYFQTLDRATRLAKNGKDEEAMHLYKKIALCDPTLSDGDAELHFGYWLHTLEQYKDAWKYFRFVFQRKDPSLAEELETEYLRWMENETCPYWLYHTEWKEFIIDLENYVRTRIYRGATPDVKKVLLHCLGSAEEGAQMLAREALFALCKIKTVTDTDAARAFLLDPDTTITTEEIFYYLLGYDN
ncbi:MAG: hypothetical protein E7624_01220 [Ruminococcaceae bacterium]|nr:hypothetical protein [Oscillospiraceae bacterium]